MITDEDKRHKPSDDQAIYCNKLTWGEGGGEGEGGRGREGKGGGGGHLDLHTDFRNDCI